MMKSLKIAGAVALVAVAVAAGTHYQNVTADPAPKVTICHAAGRDGTTHYVELNISWNAAYGQAGHFYEPGTPAAGHEDDFEGPCEKKGEPDPK